MIEIEGILKEIGNTEKGTSKKTGNDWEKTDFVIETIGEYPKNICISDFGKLKVSEVPIGSEISVKVNIESKQYKDRWFTNISGYGLAIIRKAQLSQQAEQDNTPAVDFSEDLPTVSKDDDDSELPF